ncbi:MAG: hypothetical protein JNK34_04160 [Tabrizicola sp.]|nr:hypothetical protein [Tabrizicola sp.]
MTVAIGIIVTVLFLNAVVSFGFAFFWQLRVILTLYGISDWKHAFFPWRALGNPDSPQNTFGRFIAGEVRPDLRRKWLKAIVYVVTSYAVLFLVVGLVQLVAPEYLP